MIELLSWHSTSYEQSHPSLRHAPCRCAFLPRQETSNSTLIPACCTSGINIVLISRTQSRLDEAAKEIGTKYNVKTKTLAVDFGKADAGTWSTLKAEVRPIICQLFTLCREALHCG